jgi:hypothetical protein
MKPFGSADTGKDGDAMAGEKGGKRGLVSQIGVFV